MSTAPSVPAGLSHAPSPIAKYWWPPVVAGVLTFGVGAIALAYPGPTLKVVGFLFGIYLALWGVLTLVDSVGADGLPGSIRALSGVLGLISILAGLVLMVRPGESVVTFAMVLGLWWALTGAIELVRGFVSSEGRVPNLLWGVLGIVAGTVILVQPEIGLGALVLIAGIGLMLQGVAEIVAGLALRKVREVAA